MRRIIFCIIATAFCGGVAAASGYSTGSAFRHVARVDLCGTPRTGVTWQANRATQTFSRCGVVRATYRTVLPASPTATPRPTALPTSTPWPTAIPTATQPASSDPVQQLLALLNQHRTAYGSPSLSLITDATTNKHASDMAADGTIWHTSPNHPDTSFPYDSFIGENVGAGQSVQQIDQLMIGEGTSTCRQGTISHACNIVDGRFTQVAIGLAYGPPYGVYLAEDFR